MPEQTLVERLRSYDPNPGKTAWQAAERIERLEAALEAAAAAMTCRRDDDAHYCPNCDNSLYEARDKARAALSASHEGEE